MISTTEETPATLRLAAQFLLEHATLREAMESGGQAPLAPTVPVIIPPPPSVPTGTPPAPLLSNVVPLVPPAPAPVVPPAPAASNAAAPAAATSTPAGVTAPFEFDTAGMPWDARIHQKHKSKKKDGTWKLQKNIDPALVASVTQELHALRLTPSTVGASAPVPLPPGSTQTEDPAEIVRKENEARAQAYAQGQNGSTPPAPSIPPAPTIPPTTQTPVIPPPPVHVQPSLALGVPNGNNEGVLPPVTEFRALVAKISAARNSTPPKLTADELAGALQQAGVPSLQMLGSMSHLVPTVDTIIDSIVLSK